MPNITTQVIARENIARTMCDIAVLACTIEQIAKEIRNLQRPEIGELMEAFGKKQVGSSAMPQKRNPIECENICSNARIVRSCVYPALENIVLEHERDLTNSASERSLLPTAFILMDDMLVRMDKVLNNLVVFKDRMKMNLELARGTIFSEAIVTELVDKGMSRQKAHEILREASMKALESHLKTILLKEREIMHYLNKKDLDRIMSYDIYIALSSKKTDDIIKKWKR